MRKVLYIVILALLFLAPLEREDVAKLLPVGAVAVYLDGAEVVLETDAAYMGRGDSVDAALEDLKSTTPAVVYLDTAEYLLLAEDAVSYADQLRQIFKPSVKVCVCQAAGRVKEAAKYLDVHGNLPKLSQWKAGVSAHVEK